jgi:hypothetical protein
LIQIFPLDRLGSLGGKALDDVGKMILQTPVEPVLQGEASDLQSNNSELQHPYIISHGIQGVEMNDLNEMGKELNGVLPRAGYAEDNKLLLEMVGYIAFSF